MHVAGAPGSHAVLRRFRPEGAVAGKAAWPPADVLRTAAGLCAFYSKAKSQPNVEVHATICGKVSKLPFAPAGQVLLRGGWETLRVKPLDPAALRSKAAGQARGPAASPPKAQQPTMKRRP